MARPKNCKQCKKPKPCDCGRPTVMTEAVIGKLEEAFSFGCSDREACLFADINPDTLYVYCQKNPSFAERKEMLKERPVMLARKTVVVGIMKGETDLAFKFLKAKKSDEFSEKVIQEIAGITAIEILPPQKKDDKKLS